MSDEPLEFRQTINLYLQKEYRQAYELITRVCDQYPEWQGRAYEIRMDLAALCGDLVLAEDILSKALDMGFFYNEFVLRKDEDIRALQGRPRFEALAKKSLAKLKEIQLQSFPKLKVIEPEQFDKGSVSLLMGLHGNNSNHESFSRYWNYFTENKWLVALPQSSEVSGKNLFVWNDLARAEKEILGHYQALEKKYCLLSHRTIISGFSKGGHAAILAALKGLFPIRGFLALAPFVGDLSTLLPLLKADHQRNLRGYFVLGGLDEHCTPGAYQLMENLKQNGVACEAQVFPKMGHDIPDNFDEVAQKALDFLLEE